MVRLIKDGVIMDVDKFSASIFKEAGYEEIGNKIPFSNPDNEKNTTHEEAKEEKVYSKTDISRMSVAELKTYAPTIGIGVDEESTGASLKKDIIEKLGL